jgi:hypothetical protein
LIDELADKVVTAAAEGKKLPESRSAITDHAEEARVRQIQAQVLEQALDRAALTLTNEIQGRLEASSWITYVLGSTK